MRTGYGIAALVALALALGSAGCVQELVPVFPQPEYDAVLGGTTAIPDSAKRRIEGVYEVVEGDERFGDTVVLNYSGDELSIFAERNVAFMVLRGGASDSSLVFTGTWRFAQDVSTGRVELSIAAGDGARDLLAASSAQPVVVLRGASGGPSANATLSTDLVLRRLRPIARRIQGFWNIAHRGGGRNSDRHPYSENSIPMIMYAQHLGATGVEIDVRMTKDGVPILFHDERLSTRLVHGAYATGPIANYTYDELQRYTRLRLGEPIPTLDEALDSIVRATDLSLVWLDVKDPAVVPAVLELMRRHAASAVSLGRSVELLHGIPDEAILASFQSAGGRGGEAICELSADEASRIGAAVWAPRWTLGTLDAEVARMHAEGRRVFVWTIDEPTFITRFLNEGDFDGFLTNYPTLVAYHAYTKNY